MVAKLTVGEDGRIVPTPVRVARADEVRTKLEAIEITEDDIAEAVAWARRPGVVTASTRIHLDRR
jgi:hypothetical protein